MADVLADLPLGKLLPPGRHGAETGAGILLRRISVDACTLVAGRDRAAVIEAARKCDITLVDAPRRSRGGDLTCIGAGPGRWLVLSPQRGLTARLEQAFSPEASVFAQGGGVIVLEASGSAIAAVLAKLVPLDLERFAADEAVVTTAAYINLTLWRQEENGWRLALGRSYLAAFLRAFACAAAEYGLDWMG